MKLPGWAAGEVAKLWAMIIVGIGVGLMGAYGRERHEGRRPDANWLINRLLIMPLLALGAAFAADQFGLHGNVLGFASAMLSLLGYDAVRVMTARALSKAEHAMEGLLPPDAAIHVPAGESLPAVVELEPQSGERTAVATGIGEAMRKLTSSTLKAPLPPEHEEPLRRLGKDDPR